MTDLPNIALGRTAAIERVLALLIATHPSPARLVEAWKALVPGWREDLRSEYADDLAFLNSALKALDRFERHVQIAAAATPQSEAPTSH